MIYESIFELVGRTPNIRFKTARIRASVYIKLEGTNPTGSIKDRACAFILKSAKQNGVLEPGAILLDASSGNFACALSYYGKVLGHSSTVVVSSKLTEEKRRFLSYLGTTIYEFGEFTFQGNQFCRELVNQNPARYLFVDQLHNWGNPQSHYELTGPEIAADFKDLAMIVGSLGSGGAMCGIARYMKKVAPNVKIVTVECASGSRIPGTGTFVDGDYVTPFIKEAHENRYFDHSVRISQKEAESALQLLLQQGIFCGLQTGAVLHAALNSAEALNIQGTVVVLSGDAGWKNLQKLGGR